MKRDSRTTSSSLDVVEASDPVRRSALSGEDIEAALDEIGAAIVRLPGRETRRLSPSPRRAVLVVAAALIAIGAGVATAAVVFGAHTGLFPTPTEQAIGGPGEELNPAAPDFNAVALQIASDIPYPKGFASWRDWIVKAEAPASNVTRPGDATSPFPAGLVTTGALHGWFAASAFCAWVQDWRRSSIAGDAPAAAHAAQTIAQAPSWTAVTDEDPHPDPSAANDPGAASGTLFGWMLPYRDAVLAADGTRVDHLLTTGYGGGRCWLSDPSWMAQLTAHRDTWGQLSQSELAGKYRQYLANGRA